MTAERSAGHAACLDYRHDIPPHFTQLRARGIAVDVDNPEDLQQLLWLPGETHAQRLVREYARAGTV